MEIRAVQTDNQKAPVTGEALYIIVEEANHQVRLFHPYYLVEFSMPAVEYNSDAGMRYWPINESATVFPIEKFVANLKKRVEDLCIRQRSFPVQTVVRIFMELGQMTLEQAQDIVKGASQSTGGSSKKLERLYSLHEGVDPAAYGGRTGLLLKAVQEAAQEGSGASYLAIAEKFQWQPKKEVDAMKADKIKLATTQGVLNWLWKSGLVDVAGEERPIQKSKGESEMANGKAPKAKKEKKAKKAKAPGRDSWLYRLAAGVDPEKTNGQAGLILQAVKKISKGTAAEVAAAAKELGYKAKAGVEKSTKGQLNALVNAKKVILEKPKAEEAAAA